jgi:hypothetical protein
VNRSYLIGKALVGDIEAYCPPNCGGGKGNTSSWGNGEKFSYESKRMEHRVEQGGGPKHEGHKLFIDSFMKDSEKNWLEKGRDIKVTEQHIDIDHKNKSAYLEYIKSFKEGKGYASESLTSTLGMLKRNGMRTATTYTETHNLAPQGMLRKAGFKVDNETKTGIYWKKEL